MDIFNVIAGISSILGLAVSLFVATKVIKISQMYEQNFKNTQIAIGNKNKQRMRK